MDLRQLECFVRVVELGSMTRAAAALNVAQPALGARIKKLEEEVGGALLIRHSRGVTATAAGAELLERAKVILKLVNEARIEIIRQAGSAVRPLRLGMTPSLMNIIGPYIADRAVQELPRLKLSLSEDMSHILASSLRREEVDLILAYDVPDETAFWRLPLYREDLVFVTTAARAAEGSIAFTRVLDEVLILPERHDSVRALIERTAAFLGGNVRVGQEIRSISGIKAMILRGVGAGVLPYATVMDDVRDGLLAIRPIDSPELRRILFLAGIRNEASSQDVGQISKLIQDAIELLASAMGPLGRRLTDEAQAAI